MDVKRAGPVGQLWLITGERGAGKTLLCQRQAAQARLSGLDVAGVLSPGVFEAGEKIAIQVEDVRSGERRLLASRAAPLEGRCSLNQSPNPTRSSFDLGWSFDLQALEWGNTVLQQATPCDVLIVDELGPLEFLQGQGWQAGLHAISGGAYRLALVVVRPSLLSQAQQRWPAAGVIPAGGPGKFDLLAEL
ncbi:MAG: nucleoside-triphosphatase [Chloroflexota bacterium]